MISVYYFQVLSLNQRGSCYHFLISDHFRITNQDLLRFQYLLTQHDYVKNLDFTLELILVYYMIMKSTFHLNQQNFTSFDYLQQHDELIKDCFMDFQYQSQIYLLSYQSFTIYVSYFNSLIHLDVKISFHFTHYFSSSFISCNLESILFHLVITDIFIIAFYLENANEFAVQPAGPYAYLISMMLNLHLELIDFCLMSLHFKN